jgi:hypothetical protein
VRAVYGSDATRAIYADDIAQLAKALERFPGMLDARLNGSSPIPPEGPLRLLVLRRSDLGDLPDPEEWAMWNACDTPAGPAPEGLWAKSEAAQQRLLHLIRDSGFMPDIPTYAFSDHGGVDDLIAGVVGMAIGDHASSAYLPGYVEGVPGRLAILILEDTPNTPRTEIALQAGLPVENIRPDITGDPALYIVLHEGVHAASGHAPHPEPGDYCKAINPALLDENTGHETAADRGADIGYQPKDGFMEAIAHARAITALLHNSNSRTAFRYDADGNPTGLDGEYIQDHVTTWGWDRAAPDLRGDFDVARMQGLYAVPLMVNTLADAVAGYLYETEQLAALDRGEAKDVLTGEPLNPAQAQQWYATEPSGPEFIVDSLDYYAGLGEEARRADPSRHHAAMAYLGQNGHFRTLARGLKPDYVEAIKDTVVGYQLGIKAITQGIVDRDLIARTGAALEGADFEAIAQAITAPLRDGMNTPEDLALPPRIAFKP